MSQSQDDILDAIRSSAICVNDFHWLKWHFTAAGDVPVPFGCTLLDSLERVDSALEGYASRTVEMLASLPDRDRVRDDYDQMVQRLAEVVVARRLVEWGQPLGARFVDEPTAHGSEKNPEIGVTLGEANLYVEVKTAQLRDHATLRASQSLQFVTRVFPPEMVAGLEATMGSATRPRDNPIKDFLRSANEKFAAFKKSDPDCRCVLVIVWDDHAHEVLAALVHARVGLLTDQSWLRDGDAPEVFPHIDAVVVTGHQLLIHGGLADEPPFASSRGALVWAHPGLWFGVVAVDNPAGARLTSPWADAFSPRPLGPEEGQNDMVLWFSSSADSPLNNS